MARVRVHQHVNPLARYYRELPVKPILLETIFTNPAQPVSIDIGCGRGRFLLAMAKRESTRNFIGIEIREPLVIEANEIAANEGADNVVYEFCNATIDLETLLAKLPKDILKMALIQFPDPWFKAKHAKRRMVRKKLVETISNHLANDGNVFVQTDVEFLFQEICELFEEIGFTGTKLDDNPFPIKTEREISVENRSLTVYRKILSRTIVKKGSSCG
ncbi:MAG: tRNA (guanosine(46)-N7)-methyltransferase TrmB [Pyrinomonadaceae bacterium]